MEKEKPLPWIALLGSTLTMLTLVFSFAINTTTIKQYIGAFQPLANFLAVLLLILGIILIYVGIRKTE